MTRLVVTSAFAVAAARTCEAELTMTTTETRVPPRLREQYRAEIVSALREEFSALRSDAFDHAHFGAEVHRHWASSLYHSRREPMAASDTKAI